MASATYVDCLLQKCDILCLQEHHLIETNMTFIQSINVNFECFTRCEDGISLSGFTVRKGGISIMWRHSMSHYITPLYHVGNNRIQVIKLKSHPQRPLYICNIYMPPANLGYMEYENCINDLIDIYNIFSLNGDVMLVGDFNVTLNMGPRGCPGRSEDLKRSQYLEQFLKFTHQNSIVTQAICTGPKVTYLPYSGSPGTQIDHIVINNAYIDKVISACVYDDDPQNTSDHLPVCIKWRHNAPRIKLQTRQVCRWDKADKQLYSYTMECLETGNHLDDNIIDTPEGIDDLCNTLIAMMTKASDYIVPKSKFAPHLKPY